MDQEAADVVGGEPKLKVTIKNWHGVASWQWQVDDESCGICRSDFDAYCPDCRLPGDDCPPVWGKCSHTFHLHCILKWVNAQEGNRHCPLCRKPWEFN